MNPDDSLLQRFGKAFPRGTVLFREGEPAGEMFVIHRGHVRITMRAGAQEQILSTLGPGEFLGEMAILTGKPRSATATCVEDSMLLVIEARTFEAMLRGNAEIAARMIRKLAERLEQANETIENLLVADPIARVAHFLAGLATREPRGIRLSVPTSDLPGRLSLDKAVIDGAVDHLVRARVVIPLEGGLAVPDVGRLRQFLDFLRMKAQFGEGP
jgi:CRP-like cAMP-binding protein